jgi:chromate reductase, NAD(P)H dehydrogenase (quinone)
MTFQVMTLAGSLRAHSTNGALLEAAGLLAPTRLNLVPYREVSVLPHFNADLESAEADLPPAVSRLRHLVGAADAIIISSPEYARGVPGALKNALDWLVGATEFPNKPVALFNASARSLHAQAALRLTLETMSAAFVDKASITVPLLGQITSGQEIVRDPEAAVLIESALAALLAHLVARRMGQIAPES